MGDDDFESVSPQRSGPRGFRVDHRRADRQPAGGGGAGNYDDLGRDLSIDDLGLDLCIDDLVNNDDDLSPSGTLSRRARPWRGGP